MLFFDERNYPVEQNFDGGDSAVRAGILLLTMSAKNIKFDVGHYEKKQGYFVRHPNQVPWNNENNYTRDQMMPFIAGLNNHGCHLPVKRLFYARMKKFFFAQNTERDHVGSKKYQWPHYFYKDSKPNTDTWFGGDYHSGKYKPIDGYEIECKSFDGPDILFINHIGAMIIAGRVWLFAPLLLIAKPLHFMALFFHSLKSKQSVTTVEQNQMIAECSIYKTIKLFRKLNSNWKYHSERYWSDRNEIEYHYFLKEYVDG